MNTRATLTCLLTLISFAAAASAQEPSRTATDELLRREVHAQARRIEALEAQLARMQQMLEALNRQEAGTKQPAAAVPGVPGVPGVRAVPTPADAQPPIEHAVDGAAPADVDPQGPTGDLPHALPIDAYGSLRIVSAIDTRGHAEVRNNATRIGLRGEKALASAFTAFARLEFGVNLAANDHILISADPGSPIGQGSQAVASRLGYVGVKTPAGSLSWGKQWGAYYDIAAFTDQFHVFGGAAHGGFAAGTDGGIAGTGRAERAFQYRESRGPVSVALQVQNRTSSTNDRGWADTWGASVILGAWRGFDLGAAYNEVRDGVANPTPNESQLGDKATIVGLRYRHERWYAATTFSFLKQHEVDDLGRRFDGAGFELAVRRTLTERLSLEGGYNDLRPESEHPGDYRVRFGLGNVVYHFGAASRLFGGFKIEDSRRADGSRLAESTIAGGLNFTF